MDPTPPCKRCAQLGRGLERLGEYLREKEARIQELERQLREKEARLETVEQRLQGFEKRAHRSVAPHRRRLEQRSQQPKPPGPPPGHPPAFRRLPTDAPIETVTAPELSACPHCLGPIQDVRELEQVIVDLPPITPIYTRVRFYSAHCPSCGRVHSTHPLQVSTATGAAGVHLGATAQALAVGLRHSHGLPTRRVCRILWEQFALPLTQGGLCQVLSRAARRLGDDYEAVRETIRKSKSAHGDETSWWLGGRMAWLWGLCTEEATLYHISRNRNTEVLERLLGERYEGVLVSDCLNVYDRYEAAAKSKCVAHHLRAIAEAKEQVGESRFLTQMARLLLAGMKLQKWAGRLPEEVYQRGAASLEARLTKLLAEEYPHREEERIAKRFRKRREAILTFVHRPEVAATNNLGERQLRPGVITRKLSCGNKTEAGARTWEVLATVAATCRQRGEEFVALVAKRLLLEWERAPG
jgi:hypothetical protein